MSIVVHTLWLAAFVAIASSYQFPIRQQAPMYRQQNEDAGQIQEVQRGLESVESKQFVQQNGPKLPEEEAQQLRQLHQVVDTMAQMLNEEEQNEAASRGSLLPKNYQRDSQHPQELMSESAIRQAIEELEQASRLERAAHQPSQYSNPYEAESRSQPLIAELESSLADSPQVPAQKQQQPAGLESLIEELGDDFLNERLLSGSQEPERLVKAETSLPRSEEKNIQEPVESESDIRKFNTPGPSLDSTEMPMKVYQQPQLQPQQQQKAAEQRQSPSMQDPSQTEQPRQQQNASTVSSLFIGQLDTQEADLGSSLTNEFYTFHEQPIGVVARPGQQLAEGDSPNVQVKQSVRPPYPANDLDLAAQTRNSISQRDNRPGREEGTIRFDFTQPVAVESQLSQPQQHQGGPINLLPSQGSHIRAPRQHPDSPSLDDPQFSTSTLLPAPDSFWRPSENFGPATGNGDINQQYSRARATHESFPSLPPSRFQSIVPSNQALNSAANRQTPHSHFTGHSFLPSNPAQSQYQGPPLIAQGRDKSLTSTSAPIISVLAGGDTVGVGNSVTWNPPAGLGNQLAVQGAPNLNQPVFPVTNQLTPSSTQTPQAFNEFNPPPPQVYPTNIPRAPLQPQLHNLAQFNSRFQTLPTNRFADQEGTHEPRPKLNNVQSSTEFSNAVEATTEDKPEPPTTTSQWFSSSSFAPTSTERHTSDTRPQSSVRSISDDVGFLPQSGFNGLTSTQVNSIDIARTEPPRGLRTIATTTSVPTTLKPPAAQGTSTANATKKEDMVIYYYYYYDDNKNATVVAKNISADHNGAHLPLNTAMESDGGLEDTPYMDDPAPAPTPVSDPVPVSISQTKPNPIRSNGLPTSTSTSTTSTTTPITAQPPSPISDATFQDTRSRFVSNSARAPTLSEPQTIARISTERNPAREDFRSSSIQTSSADHVRPLQNLRTLTSSSTRQTALEQSEPTAPTPYNVPTSTSTSRSKAPLTPNSFNRVSSEPTVTRSSSGTQNENSGSRSPIPTAPNSKIQTDLISSVLNSIPSQKPQHRLQSSTPVVPTPVSPNANNNRGPLSNASRYGTSNNFMLDPYGLDPAAPTSLSMPSLSPQMNATSNHIRNWNQHLSPPGTAHQFGRKPSTTANLSTSQPTSSATLNKEPKPQFDSQSRANNSFHPAGLRSSEAVSQSNVIAPKLASSGPRTNNVQPVAAAPARQIYPEANDPPQPTDRFSSDRIASSQLKQFNVDDTLVKQNDKLLQGRLISSSEIGPNLQREVVQRPPVIGNGRPSTLESSAGKSFSKSPAQAPITTSQPPELSNGQIQEVTDKPIPKPSSSPSPITQSTINTSVTRTFVGPQGQVTTSVSTPTVTTSSIVTTVTQSTSSSENVSPQAVLSSTQLSATSTTAAPEISPTSESSETPNSSSRRRFGNRNNRFQTRLSSLTSGSVRSTSTTTPAPSSTTSTRRPSSTTTRKSSKQLFAGRRRLGSTSADTDALSTTASSNPSSTSSTSSGVESSTQEPNRPKFGNSFTSRARPTTSSAPSRESSDLTPKPSLFGAQKPSPKPRLPFMKPTKPVLSQVSSSTESSSSSGQSGSTENLGQDGSTADSERSVTEKVTSSNDITDKSDDVVEDSSGRMSEGDLVEKKEVAPVANAVSEVSADQQVTSAPAVVSSSAPTSGIENSNGRVKPRVRPLFASRQRNSPLFGNRRNNGTTV